MDDLISRQVAIEAIDDYLNEYSGLDEEGYHGEKWCAMAEAKMVIENLLSAQPATSCSESPNTSDVVSRKAVRKMVSAWAYDLMEQEDLNMALHDVDELPYVQPEVIHCKDCKHYRTTGAFGVPLHKEEYYCDEEQRELPEWWFCAGARRKENE